MGKRCALVRRYAAGWLVQGACLAYNAVCTRHAAARRNARGRKTARRSHLILSLIVSKDGNESKRSNYRRHEDGYAAETTGASTGDPNAVSGMQAARGRR